MNVSDPVPEELEGGQLGPVVGRGAQDLTIGQDGREEARRRALALRGGDGLKGPGHVDEVLLGPLAGMVRPRAGIRERVKLLIRSWKAIWQTIL